MQLSSPEKGVLALVLIAAAAVLSLWFVSPQLFSRTSQKVEEITPTGSIYVTLLPLPAKERRMSIYTFDPERSTLDEVLGDDETDYLTSKLSPSGDRIVFGKLTGPGIVNLFVDEPVEGNYSPEMIPSKANLRTRRNPVWSPDGTKVAFMASVPGTESLLPVENWRVYVTDLQSGVETYVTNGTNPLFTPDGGLLVLRADGLYKFPASGASDGVNVWGLEGGAADNAMKLGLSSDGTLLAWAVPGERKVLLIRVSSWEPFVGSIEQTIVTLPAPAFWPIISPDNRFLAVYQYYPERDPRQERGNTVTEPQLVIYDIASGEKVLRYNLAAYDDETVSITEWR